MAAMPLPGLGGADYIATMDNFSKAISAAISNVYHHLPPNFYKEMVFTKLSYQKFTNNL